jgi:hypothetical protein
LHQLPANPSAEKTVNKKDGIPLEPLNAAHAPSENAQTENGKVPSAANKMPMQEV